ncbi:hypothetical protein L0244_34865 [bacterium]|nr:hypothetical protein [bacterium]
MNKKKTNGKILMAVKFDRDVYLGMKKLAEKNGRGVWWLINQTCAEHIRQAVKDQGRK